MFYCNSDIQNQRASSFSFQISTSCSWYTDSAILHRKASFELQNLFIIREVTAANIAKVAALENEVLDSEAICDSNDCDEDEDEDDMDGSYPHSPTPELDKDRPSTITEVGMNMKESK